MKIAVIGCGNMGSAMINAWLVKKVCKVSDLIVFEKNSEKLAFLNSKIEERNSKPIVFEQDYSKLKKVDVIVLAIKPQDVSGVLENIKLHLSKKTIIISIVAGITIKRIESILGNAKIVRSMPNMPAQISMGIVGWSSNSQVKVSDKKLIAKLLGSMGYEINFSDENKLDVVTAISGSGPAYVFYFMEALFEAGHKLGLTSEEATALAMGTFIGSSLMVNVSGESPKALRAKVTSKKGTTEAAITVFDKNNVKRIVNDAVKAAFLRAKQLNK
ncbi:pyrroline-5-carboxylate reductase [Candidatus Peregrinibacteria bacterium]|nr:pyrroline-5-carboxylate reductase [Candidatus Peregrinibacteria bacterium]